MYVLFVCMGNICRSPTAEGVMRRLIEDEGLDIEVDSAGTGGWHAGEPPDERATVAAQVVPCREELGIDPEKLNPYGGAIALGHPFGMTGARIMTTLLNGLAATDGTYGLETMCVAGGMGQAMIVERLN